MLRPLRISDVKNINRINELALGYLFPLEKTERQLTKFLSDDQHLLIGAIDERNGVVGYVHAQIYETTYSETGLNILALAVLPDYQGKGLGHSLMAELENQAKQRNLGFIRLNSGSHRTQAHAFYKAIGYQNDKTQERFLKEI